jgi:hypothetical protein
MQNFQGVNFYTQVKTVTQMWRESDVSHSKAAVSMPVMQWVPHTEKGWQEIFLTAHTFITYFSDSM